MSSKLEPPGDQWKEFEDILAEIDSLTKTLKEIKSGRTVDEPENPLDATLDRLRTDAAKLIAHRIVPLVSRIVNVPPVTLFGKVVATVLQSPQLTFRDSVNRFGISFRPARGSPTDMPAHDHRFATTLVGTFAKATFPTSITRIDKDSVDVQIQPEPDAGTVSRKTERQREDRQSPAAKS